MIGPRAPRLASRPVARAAPVGCRYSAPAVELEDIQQQPMAGEDFLARFRLRECPGCGYDLQGLPPEHVCPECGATYSTETLDLVGWSREGRMPGHWLWWRRRVVAFFFWLLCAGAAIAVYVTWGGAAAFIAQLVFFAVTMGFIRFLRGRWPDDYDNRWLIPTRGPVAIRPNGWLVEPGEASWDADFVFGTEVRDLTLRRCRTDVWEFGLLMVRPARSSWCDLTLVFHCSQDEADALATEIRRRIIDERRRD